MTSSTSAIPINNDDLEDTYSGPQTSTLTSFSTKSDPVKMLDWLLTLSKHTNNIMETQGEEEKQRGVISSQNGSESPVDDLKDIMNKTGSFVFMASEKIYQLVDTGFVEKMKSWCLKNKPIYQTKQINWGNREFSNPWRVKYNETKDNIECRCVYCVPTELQVRHTKVEKKPLEIEIDTEYENSSKFRRQTCL